MSIGPIHRGEGSFRQRCGNAPKRRGRSVESTGCCQEAAARKEGRFQSALLVGDLETADPRVCASRPHVSLVATSYGRGGGVGRNLGGGAGLGEGVGRGVEVGAGVDVAVAVGVDVAVAVGVAVAVAVAVAVVVAVAVTAAVAVGDGVGEQFPPRI